MKKIKSFIASLTTAVLLTGLALNFNACTEQSPLASVEDDIQDSVSLAKKSSYPQSASFKFRYRNNINGYESGNVNVPGGSNLHINEGSLTPPPGTPFKEKVYITMLVEKDEVKNELIFTFGPSGSQFSPAAKVTFDWTDLGLESAPNLYYIDENGNYIPQAPDNVDVQGRHITLSVDHFSRYAIGAE